MKRIIYLLVLLLALVSCSGRLTYRSAEGKVYGTFFHVSYAADKDLQREIRAEMERVNASLSMFNPVSVISRINRNESDSTDEVFRRMYIEAVEVNRQTEGAFDITVAPLVNAWGFGYERESFPDSARIDSLRMLVGMEKLSLRDGRLLKRDGRMKLDAGSIAKGLGVDLVAEYLERSGVKDYMVEIGGEVRVKGNSPKGRPWRIGIDRPEDDPAAQARELQLVVGLTGGALATSGNYRNFYFRDHQKYAHTIHPTTGYPVQTEVISASVYAPTCMEADAYATAFMVVGLEKAREIIHRHDDLEGCVIYQEGEELRMWLSEGLEKQVCGR